MRKSELGLRGDADMPPKKQCPIAVRLTFDTTTPESASEGDYSDSGWYVPDHGEWSTHESGADENWHAGRKRATQCFTNARAAADFIRDHVSDLDDARLDTYSPGEGQTTDYGTGEQRRISAHVARVPSKNVAERIFCNVLKGESGHLKRAFDKTCKRKKF